MVVDTPPAAAGLPVPRGRRLVILVTCCLALVLAAMDVTIVNIALPAIRSDLHATVAELQWSIDGYTVVVASFLLLAGSIADRFGRRKTFQLGLAVFRSHQRNGTT
jgi:MFS family permease